MKIYCEKASICRLFQCSFETAQQGILLFSDEGMKATDRRPINDTCSKRCCKIFVPVAKLAEYIFVSAVTFQITFQPHSATGHQASVEIHIGKMNVQVSRA